MSFKELEELSKSIKGHGAFYICMFSIGTIIATIYLIVNKYVWFGVGVLIANIIQMGLIGNMISGIGASLDASIRNGKKIDKIASAIEDNNQQIK